MIYTKERHKQLLIRSQDLKQIEEFTPLAWQIKTGSLTPNQAILSLRGGDGLMDIAAILAFIAFMRLFDVSFSETEAFQIIPQPHQDFFGWMAGKYNSKNAGNLKCPAPDYQSRFEQTTLNRVKQMCAASADENGYIMSYDEAINLINETYSGSMAVTEDFRISDRQAASHIYHGNGLGVKPENFGTTQAEIAKIQDEGFITYVMRGGHLPTRKHVRAYQQALKNVCLDRSTQRRDDSKYYNPHGMTPTTTFQNDRILICFNQTTKDLITGDKQRRGTIRKFNETRKIGAQKWINQWSNKSN